MPGSVIIRPIEAHFLDGGDQFDRMSSYCEVQLGVKQLCTEVCKNGGANPNWHHPLILPLKEECTKCTIEVKDNDSASLIKGTAGSCDINLEELRKEGNLRKWYALVKNGRSEGDILVEASYLPELPAFFGTKSAPAQQNSTAETGSESLKKCDPFTSRPAVRKFSDDRLDRPGRGWNLVVPEADCEEDAEDDLTLRKSKSVYVADGEVYEGKIQRRKSFWEKILDF